MASRGSTFTSSTIPFGLRLRQLRKRAGMTQRDLAAALGYSDSLISSLEKAQRQPDLETVIQRFVPALGLQDDADTAARLIESAAAARGEHPPVSSPMTLPSAPHNPTARATNSYRLPALPVELVGRTTLVDQLSNRLLGHGGRLLTLVGPPGVGKTTLALAVATQMQQHYADGALFVPLAPVTEVTLMATTLVAAIAPGDVNNKAPERRLLEVLNQRHLLLLLDNLEQIEGAAALIATLLAECPSLTILATSRERLHLRAEQRCKVPPLDLAAAVDLFVQRAQSVDDDFRLTDENRTTIAAICARLDCLPLALELCAVQIELFTPPQLLAQLQAHPLDLLVDGARDLPPQHRTLRHAIERSYALLNEEERTLFRSLGVFVGGFDLAAVAAVVTGNAEPKTWRLPNETVPQLLVAMLRSLVSKSLVRTELSPTDEQRFLLLETIREFALELLRNKGELPAIQQRYACYFLCLAEQLDQTAESSTQTYWIQRLKLDYENIRATLTWTLDHKIVEMALRFVWALRWYWSWFGWIGEGRHWSKAIVTLSEQSWSELLTKTDEHLDEISRQQVELFSRALYAESEFDTSDRVDHKRVLDRCWIFDQRCGLSSLTPMIYQRLAGYHRYYGNYTKHNELNHECLRLLPLIPTLDERTRNHHVAWSLKNLGLTAFYQGVLDCAERYYTDSRQIFTAIGNRVWAAFSSAHLSQVACYRGQIADAQGLLEQCWQEALQAGQTTYTLWLHYLAAYIALRAGDVGKAANNLSKGLQLLPRTEAGLDPTNDSELCLLLRVSSELALHIGQAEHAALLLGAVDNLVHTNQIPIHPIFQPEIEATVSNTRSHLTEAVYQSTYATGYRMTTATVVTLTQTMLTPQNL